MMVPPRNYKYTSLETLPAKQRGAAMVMIAVSIIALIAMAGLALDSGHTMLNKTRLQNAVDAAALAAAKTLDETGDITQATAAALSTMNDNANAPGSGELNASYAGGSGDIQVTVEYSETLRPFVPGAPAGPYVRVLADNFLLPAWLVPVIGIDVKQVSATAVSGPSPTIEAPVCNLAPMMVCGDPNASAETFWGYTLNAPDVLKTASGGNWSGTPGPGNFQLIRLNDGQGAADIRRNMAGAYDACIEADEDAIDTEPGNTVGPVVQGLNTRFGIYSGPMGGTQDQYPPDVIVDGQSPGLTTQQNPTTGEDEVYQDGTKITADNIDLLYNYQDYNLDLADPSTYDYQPIAAGGSGSPGRRILTIPVGDCSVTTNGQGSVPLLGFGCYFLLQPAVQQGNWSHVYGQFIDGCQVNGRPGPDPGAGPGPYVIQLYDDPDSPDS